MLLESAMMRLLQLLIRCFAVGKKEGKRKRKEKGRELYQAAGGGEIRQLIFSAHGYVHCSSGNYFTPGCALPVVSLLLFSLC